MTLWHIGNTTVRTPYRLKEALKVLNESEYVGNLVGIEREQGFAKLLNEKQVVRVDRLNLQEENVSDLGRKWRSALAQLGFVVMHLKRGLNRGVDPQIESFVKDFPGLTGRPYEITPNGNRLINAEIVAEQQECFLRALVAYKIPSIFENRYKFSQFSPLRFVLEILMNLDKIGEEPIIKFEEMAAIVQCRTPDDGIDNVKREIQTHRKERKKAADKKKYEKEKLNESASAPGVLKKGETLIDYADLNFRYLKATGLFQVMGRGIGLLPEKKVLVDLIIAEKDEICDDNTYVKKLWNGAQLPIDSKIEALKVVENMAKQLAELGEKIELPGLIDLPLAEISILRNRLEEHLQHIKESVFADQQADQWKEIVDFMNVLKNRKGTIITQAGDTIRIHGGESPVFFEWIIWRAFLAIDSLINMPWEARRFKIDQDFLPISHAPGGGPDMIFEFEEYVLVVEVTFTSSSRQEAAEGETVRRHVAEIAGKFENTGKKVYCLFIALSIDSNTADTFKSGNWYKKDDSKLSLQIVPITLDDFIILFKAGFERGRLDPIQIKQLIVECRASSNKDAPGWKKEISAEVKRFSNILNQNTNPSR